MHALRLLPWRAVQAQLQGARLRPQRLEVVEVAEHLAGRHVFLVGEREGMAVAAGEGEPGRLAALIDEHFAQPVGPGERRGADAPLDAGEIGRWCRPGSVRTTTCRRAWLAPEICALLSTLVPAKPASAIRSMRWRTSVL